MRPEIFIEHTFQELVRSCILASTSGHLSSADKEQRESAIFFRTCWLNGQLDGFDGLTSFGAVQTSN
jgi:hypothetical protein